MARIELLSVWHAWHGAAAGDLDGLVALDPLLDALKPVPVHRLASTRIGRRFMESAAPLVPDELIARYRGMANEGTESGHHAVTFGIVTASAGIQAMDQGESPGRIRPEMLEKR